MAEPVKIESVTEFIQFVQDHYHTKKPKKHLFFRGHSKISYELTPSIFRQPLSEKDILLDFKQYAPENEIHHDFIYECEKVLGDMQHHGLPTRLIDWSISPLVALYFACRKPKSREDEDGRVFIFDPWKYNSEIIEDYTQPEIHQIHITARALLAYGWGFDIIKEYLEKKYIRVKITKEDMEKPFSFVSPFTNKRKVNQRGCFTINGTDPGAVDKWDEAKKTITYLTVEKGKKHELLKELNMLYVNEYSVFPDFDGMSKMIEKHGSLFNWK